jgi:S-layer family protein
MIINRRYRFRAIAVIAVMIALTVASTRLQAQSTGTCGSQTITLPFTDVPGGGIFFCSIAGAYFSGLTSGTSATTYNPSGNVSREQMAAFITRTQDSALRRGSRRAALGQWWTPKSVAAVNLETTTVGLDPLSVQSDGADLWVANIQHGTVSRVRASDGKLLGEWTGARGASQVLVAMGRVFVTGLFDLYMIDPNEPPGPLTPVTTSTPLSSAGGIAFDGARLWITDPNSNVINIVTPSDSFPWPTTTLTGFNIPKLALFDGTNIWVTNVVSLSPDIFELVKIVPPGIIVARVPIGGFFYSLTFDGTNIWVPNENDHTLTVIRASTATVLATLTGNGLHHPRGSAFDGERILITNSSGHSVSLWRATDLSPLGSFPISTNDFPSGACSDGLNFWIVIVAESIGTPGKLIRF